MPVLWRRLELLRFHSPDLSDSFCGISSFFGTYLSFSILTGFQKGASHGNEDDTEKTTSQEKFWTSVLEKDYGQDTSNTHISARRHINSDKKTDAQLFNLLLPAKFEHVSKEELNELLKIPPNTIEYCVLGTQEVNKKALVELVGKRGTGPKLESLFGQIWLPESNMLEVVLRLLLV